MLTLVLPFVQNDPEGLNFRAFSYFQMNSHRKDAALIVAVKSELSGAHLPLELEPQNLIQYLCCILEGGNEIGN